MVILPGGSDEGIEVLTACVNGYGKRTPASDYPQKGRGTMGVININVSDRNGDVVGMRLVRETDGLMLITEKGILIRTPISGIRQTGRSAAGVRLIRLDDGDKLVALARVDTDPTEAVADASAPDAPPTDTPPAEPPPETPA